MATFKTFEEILAWQKSRTIVGFVYQATNDSALGRDFALRDQIRRSAISIMANIAEGHGRRSDKEFANFLNYARGSVAETQSHLYLASDLEYIDENSVSTIYNQLDEVSRMLNALMKHLSKT